MSRFRVYLRAFFSCLALLLALPSFAASTDAEVENLYRRILPLVSYDRIDRTYSDIAAFGSRLTGSKGETDTFLYVKRRLQALGATNVRMDPFTVSIPDPESLGTLSIAGASATILPIWPNLVRTSTCHAKGPLIYGGDGSLEQLSGKNIRGSIVLIEFNSGSRWRNAAKLGAAAVVLLQPNAMPRPEAEQKFAATPLDTPRFYLPLRDAGPLLTAAMAGREANLNCTQNWVQRTSYNLSAEFPGTGAAQEKIALLANADGISVVPALTPAAESIGGIAAMLEMARIYSQEPHTRTLECVLSGAHALALRGAREFVKDRIADGNAPLLTVTLDLSSGSTSIGSYARGWFYEFRDETRVPMEEMSRVLRTHADHLAKVEGIAPARLLMVDAVNNGDSRSWKNNIPGKFALDCEPLVCAGMNALTFRTIEDSRQSTDTPLDTIDKVKISNVVRQTQTVLAMLYHLLNDTSNSSDASDYRIPLGPAQPSTMRLIGGFGTIHGRVVSYDPQKSFIPDEQIANSIACVRGKQKTLMGVRGDMLQGTGPTAEYRFDGIPPITAYNDTDDVYVHIAAFHVHPKTGKIDYAPTLAIPGFEAYSTNFPLNVSDRESPIVVFPCVTLDLFDMVDPQELTSLTFTDVLDADTGAYPRNVGLFAPTFDQRLSPEMEDAQVIFLLSGQRFQLLSGNRGDFDRLVLTNSTLGNDKGIGYTGPGGKPRGGRSDIAMSGMFPDLPLETAIDFVNINDTRLAKFKRYRILSPDTELLETEAHGEIEQAQKALQDKQWANVDRHSRAAWGFALRAHPIIMGTGNDVVNGVVFYLFLLIPFSYFLERLLIGNQLMAKQLAWSVAFFVAAFVLLRYIHPAFEIVSNPSMIFIAFVMGALSLIVITFILGKFENSMRAIRAQQSGVHEVDIRRSSVAMAAFNLGVSNMRRRKARTILTTLTLVVMTFIVLSFTSIVDELRLDETPSNNLATYPGILMRNPGLDPLQLATYRQIANEFGDRATVTRRAYYYGADIGDVGILSLQRGDSVAEVRAMLGLDPGEKRLLDPSKAIYAGRWFLPGERNVMVLPRPIAESLKIDPSEAGKAKVTYAGADYTVVGLADTSILRAMTDLDGDGIMPADFSLSKEYQTQKATSNQAFRSFIRIDPGSVFILPAETAMDLGADLRSVAVEFNNPNQTRPALANLMPRLRLNLYAGVPSTPGSNDLVVKQFAVQQGSKSAGLLLIGIQLIIAAIFVLNTMVASVFERTKEISIFSSIGLAPNHISMLFFAESLVYGILGAVIGYFLAQITAKIIVATHTLQGLVLNFSSTSAVLSAVLVMAVVIGSTIYPAKMAAKIAAPAVNEEVFKTEPEGDVWELPLPFSIGAAEAGALASYFTEWLRAYEGYTIGDIVTADTTLTVDDPPGAEPRYCVRSTTWLAPYDLGINQRFQLDMTPGLVEGVYLLDLKLTRLAGDPENWPIVNGRFLATIRKQFLTWRTLNRDERARFERLLNEIPTEPKTSLI